jgi:hypothetical protein
MRVKDFTTNGNLINGGSNVCVTGDLNFLLDVVDIAPIDISVMLSGSSSSLNLQNFKMQPPPSNSIGWYNILPNMLLLRQHGQDNNISHGCTGI